MDIPLLSQYANIASAVIALLMAIPTALSFYRGWNVTIRRTFVITGCIFVGIFIGTSIGGRSGSQSQHEATGQIAQTKEMLQAERAARETAERRADQAEQQAKNDRLARESAEQKVGKLDSTVGQLETELHGVQRKLTELSNTPNPTTPALELPAAKASPPSKAIDVPPPGQKLEHFVVEVPRAQISGDDATVYVRFTSTAPTRIKMLLAAGFLGDGKTFLVDDLGQRYDLDNASGIGKCCFGLAGGDWQGGILELPPKGNADVTLTFRRRGHWGEPLPERAPEMFRLSAELTIGDAVRVDGWGTQWQSRGSAGISIAGITAK